MRKTSIAVAAMMALAALPVAPAFAQSSGGRSASPADTRTRLDINSELIVTQAGIRWLDYTLRRAEEQGDLILGTQGPDFGLEFNSTPIRRDDVLAVVREAVLAGAITSAEGAAMIVQWSRESGVRIRLLRARREELVRREQQLLATLADLDRRTSRPLQPWELGRPPAAGRGEVDKQPVKGCVGFVGTWNTNYGPMWIGGGEGAINGSYDWNSAYGPRSDTLSGTVSGNVASGTYTQPGFPEPQWRSGRFTFTLSGDGQSFSGVGYTADGGGSMSWNGTCAGGAGESGGGSTKY